MLSDQALIDIAGIIGESGTCSRLQVGAVLTRERRIISTGYNGAPAGMDHCVHDKSDLAVNPGCNVAVHAEANVIAFAARHGVSTLISTLYTTHSPCLICARLLINAGIKEVIYEHEYRDPAGLAELRQAGIRFGEIGKPLMRPVSPSRGDGEGMHPGKRTHPGFEDTETASTPDFDRRGPRL